MNTRTAANIYENNQGISVILSVIILATLVGLIITIATVAQTITRSNRSIENSEVAFYAAESAAELTVYEIVRNNRGLDLPHLMDQPLDVVADAFWDSEVKLSTSTPGLCGAPNPKPICSDDPGTITTSNALEVTLQPGQSFQMDLTLEGADYPDRVQITWSGGSATRVYTIDDGVQSVLTNSPVSFPKSPDYVIPANSPRFRIVNEEPIDAVVYQIKPQGGSVPYLPLGLTISTIGKHNGTERRLDISHPSWLIY